MVAEDTWGILQEITKLAILRAPLFASNRLWREKISFKSIFYYLACYLHLVNQVFANEFDEI